MSIIYSISILPDSLRVAPSEGECANVLKSAIYRIEATDGEHTASLQSTAVFPEPGDGFIAFEELTESIVLGWVDLHFADVVSAEQAALAAVLAEQASQPVTMRAPWAAEEDPGDAPS
ncbi:MAG: hypothetical protein KJZ75_11125 [Hyphomonadaceae bacterium]|nr:hypothetical protein [Hyphomonadaceae bacterium]